MLSVWPTTLSCLNESNINGASEWTELDTLNAHVHVNHIRDGIV